MQTISFSHIAWPVEVEEGMMKLLFGCGVRHLELAPVRAFGNPLLADEKAVKEKRDFYQQHGFRIGSFQALLFGSENLHLFCDRESRERMKEWLISVGRVAGWCGAGPLVFGSPKNRLRGEIPKKQADVIAAEFFREVGEACAEYGCSIVMEANPPEYGADYCDCLADAAEIVALVNSPGFRLHLDAGGLAISGEEFATTVEQCKSLITHFHASQINLGDWKEPHVVHKKLSDALRGIDYHGHISIEMRATEPYEQSVITAIKAVKEIYLNELG